MKLIRYVASWFGKAGLMVGLLLGLSLASAEKTYIINDPFGNPVLATDEAGNVVWKETYRPYGARVNNPAAEATNAIGFAGKPFDPDTGLSYMGARYYDPVIGRFMGVDPAPVVVDNLNGINRYAYANNNPYRYVDPNGRTAWPIARLEFTLVYEGATILGAGAAGSWLGGKLWDAAHQEQSSAKPPSELQQSGQAKHGPNKNGANGEGAGSESGDKPPSTPTGRRGSPLEVKPGTNEPAEIGGREFTGHALDRGQGRGVPPSVVEDAIQNGTSSPGKYAGTTVHGGQNGVTVVTGTRGQVITVITK